MPKNCLLCASDTLQTLPHDSWWCRHCDLRFLDPSRRLGPEEEKARYLLHNNDPSDPGYQRFVDPLYQEIIRSVKPGSKGLDYGSGAGPVLAQRLERDAFPVTLYDPFFAPDVCALETPYDFIFACEVAEHFFDPAREFKRLSNLLHEPGLLALMTLLCDDQTDFETWYYRRDPTHVCFYSQKTFRWIAEHHRFSEPVFVGDRIVKLFKA